MYVFKTIITHKMLFGRLAVIQPKYDTSNINQCSLQYSIKKMGPQLNEQHQGKATLEVKDALQFKE